MGQKANPISLQVGNKINWDTEFAEKKSRDTGVIRANSREVESFLERSLIKHGFQMQDLKIRYQEGAVKIFVSLYYTSENKQFVSKKLRTSKRPKIVIKNKFGKLCGIKNKKVFFTFTALLIKALSQIYSFEKKIIISFNLVNKQVLNIKNQKELKRNLIGLRRYERQKFYKEGIEACVAVAKDIKFLPLLSNFLTKYLKTVRKVIVLIKFLKRFLKLLIESPNYVITGIQLKIKGRINSSNRAKTKILVVGDVPLHSTKTNLNYQSTHARHRKGSLGLKIWLVGR